MTAQLMCNPCLHACKLRELYTEILWVHNLYDALHINTPGHEEACCACWSAAGTPRLPADSRTPLHQRAHAMAHLLC